MTSVDVVRGDRSGTRIAVGIVLLIVSTWLAFPLVLPWWAQDFGFLPRETLSSWGEALAVKIATLLQWVVGSSLGAVLTFEREPRVRFHFFIWFAVFAFYAMLRTALELNRTSALVNTGSVTCLIILVERATRRHAT